MRRNLKAPGLALFAAFALSATMAAGASAQEELFHAGAETVFLTGKSTEPAFTIGAAELVCASATYEGTVEAPEGTTDEVTLHPIYDEPCPFGGAEVTVRTHGCDFTLTSDEVEGHADVGVECTGEQRIEIDTHGLCDITIIPFKHGTTTGGVTYTSTLNAEGEPDPNGKTMTVDATVGSIPYEAHGEFCGLIGIFSTTNHDGVYHDDVLVSAHEEEDMTQNSTAHTWSGTHGDEVKLWQE